MKNSLILHDKIIEKNILSDKKIFTEYNQKKIVKYHDELAILTHKNDTHNKQAYKFTFIDLFAGIGGVRQAFENIGGKCIFSSEIDSFAKFTYYTNFGVVPFSDITKISTEEIPNHDVLCAGFPCQPFSYIGKRQGFKHPTQGSMFYEIIRIIKDKKTPIIFLENVSGILNHNHGHTLSVIIESLENIGYKVKYNILDSSQFGIPQIRKRFYLVAFLDKTLSFQFPTPPMLSRNIGDIIQTNVTGYSISKHLQKTYLFKKNDGKPELIDKNSIGSIKTLVSTYYKIQRLTGTFVKDGETGIRLLTKDECKAIMGFPENFIIPVSRTQMYRQLGNSVVIPVVTEIAAKIDKYLLKNMT